MFDQLTSFLIVCHPLWQQQSVTEGGWEGNEFDKPPFGVGKDSILILINLGKKLIELRARYDDSRPCKGTSQLLLVDHSIIVAINMLEHLPKARFGIVDKLSEFLRSRSTSGHGTGGRGGEEANGAREQGLLRALTIVIYLAIAVDVDITQKGAQQVICIFQS